MYIYYALQWPARAIPIPVTTTQPASRCILTLAVTAHQDFTENFATKVFVAFKQIENLLKKCSNLHWFSINELLSHRFVFSSLLNYDTAGDITARNM